MKVYVVTDGSYSEYAIKKIFSNRSAAEEYKKWHRIYNEIEEWEVNDAFSTEPGSEAEMFIAVEGDIGVSLDICPQITFEIRPNIVYDSSSRKGVYISQYPWGFRLRIYRYVPADKWNEDLWKKKMEKILYDYAGIAKDMFAEGATKDMVWEALNYMGEDEE